MSSINHRILKNNHNIDVNFEGGNLSSDSGLLLIHEFIHQLGIDNVIKELFQTNDHAIFRIHTDFANFMQMLYQITLNFMSNVKRTVVSMPYG